MAILAVCQYHTSEEGAKGGGKPHRLHQHGDGDHQQQGGGDEDLPHVGLGYGTEHRPHQVVAAQHYAGDGGDHQQAVLPARQIRIAVADHRRDGEQRQYGQDGNDGDVLEQQHSEGGSPALALHQFALLQALQHYGGGGERQNKPDGEPLLPGQAKEIAYSGQGGAGEQHLQATGAEYGPLQLPQQGRAQLEADQEQHQHHPELGEVHHILLLPHQPQQEGAYDDARQQVTEHRAQPPALGQRHRYHRRREIDQGVKQQSVPHQPALRSSLFVRAGCASPMKIQPVVMTTPPADPADRCCPRAGPG
ncbi:hypothetical protein D3C75_527440 [compost metagenome]